MAAKITLDITEGPMKGRTFVFEAHDTFIFGRDVDCHARLAENDTTASRQHFILEVNPPDARVRDLGSLNGTFVNDAQIGKRDPNETPEQGRMRRFPEIDLHHGDRVKVGASVFALSVEAHVSCNDCGAPIDAREKEALMTPSGVCVCAACRKRAASQATELPSAPRAVVCRQCAKDVTREIGAGRSGDYVCSACQAGAVSDPMPVLASAIRARLSAPTVLPTSAPSAAGETIPGYVIGKTLGVGGMGAVYAAQRTRDGALVAIKVMLAKVAVSEHLRQMFAREIDVTARVRHPNIIPLHEHGSAGPGFYFVMDLCPEGSVDRLMAVRGGMLSVDEALPLALSALEGLAHIHAQGYVHRDLKPANLLIASPGVAKIADLGLAKSFDQAGLSGMTLTGGMGGTVVFMPKEQITNYKHVKPVTDVFGFGATLYNMLTGDSPRDYPPGADPMHVILRGPIVPIRQRNPRIPPRIAEVIDRACAHAWAERWPNAGEMRDALARAM